MIGIELMMACAPAVAHETIQQVIHVESRGDPLAINVNKGQVERKPSNAEEASALARHYIEKGYTVDLGLMQINSTNVARLGYRIEDMFEPCKNIAAGARVLSEFYVVASYKYDNTQVALLAALSAYNTGNFIDGFTNGYIARYGVNRPVPRLQTKFNNPYMADTAVFINLGEKITMNNSNPYTADTDVKFKPENEVTTNSLKEIVKPVISQSEEDMGTPGVQVEYTADIAEQYGAFEETAMSEKDAWESNMDMEFESGMEPAFLDDEGPSEDIPPFITTTNIRELYNWKPGELLKDAILRNNS